jgi:hypothetical protein
MPHSPDADPFIVSAWQDALQDAAADDADYYLVTCAGAATQGAPKAVSFRRGKLLDGDVSEGGIVVGSAKLDEANAHAGLNRVATFEHWEEDDPLPLAVLAGLLRHEIEHGRQRDLCPNSFALYELTDAIIELAVGDKESRRALFHSQPVEWDANAAASRYLRHHPVHQAVVPELLAGRDTYLVRSAVDPGDPQHLVARAVAFLYSLREATLEQAVVEGQAVEDLLDDFVAGAGALWQALETAALCQP